MPFLVPASLNEHVLVGLALGAEREPRRPPDNRPGESAFGAVTVQPQAPVAAPCPPEQPGLRPEAPDADRSTALSELSKSPQLIKQLKKLHGRGLVILDF